ncbi:MAG: hypothetical protein IPO67_01310 [Deltaproteobacteria bacterium]|nr:hypothetical protein [Deltaproteobacteria bacterium]
MALNGLSDLNVLMFKTAQSEQRYVEVVLDHIARLSAARLSNAGAQEVSRLANSLLFVFSMAQLPAEPREAKEFVDELRGRVSGLLWERVFEHLAPGIWIQPALDAEDSPDDPVPHDVVVVPYLRDLPALSRASDMLYKATEVGVKAYESLARRMLDVKLRLPTPVTDPAEPPSTVAGDVVTALASLITNVDGERELSSAQHLKDRFLPRAAHRGLLSADVLIIQGEKGAGKSALFMAFQDREFLLQLARYAGVAANQQERLTRTDLMVGFEAGMNSALSQPVVSLFATFQSRSWRRCSTGRLRGFWRGLLCAQLIIHRHDFTVPGDAPLPPLTVIPTVTNAHTLSLSPERQTELILWLQEVMRRAKAKNKQLWVLYDGLDAHLTSAPQRRGPLISALVDLWWDLRGQPISARIFLRQDLWDREVSLVDKAKIISGTYRVQLEWDAEELYRLLIKRLLVAESFQQLLREHKLWRDDLNPRPGLDRLGLVPPSDEAWLQEVVAALVGEHMGVGSKKGGTYTWIVKHLGDANGRVRPRSLLTLFALAATKQGADLKGRAPLDQARLREALRTGVSPQGVAELKQEFALEWMSGDVWVPDTFKEHETLWPVDYEPLKRFLSKRLKLPVSRVSELLYQMAVSGLLEHRTTQPADKIQVPDIYLYGLGLTRKG